MNKQQKNWLAVFFEYGREAKEAGLSEDYIRAIMHEATSKDRKNLDEVLAREFYKLRTVQN